MIPFIDLATQQSKIKSSIYKRMTTVLAHGKFILGPEVDELEGVLAKYVGVSHCVTCANGTDALLIALMTLGVGKGDEVITTAFSYIATGEVITRLGATPIFIDIDKNTYNIDVTKIEEAITSRTRVIMPVSLYGQCADFDAINSIASKYHLSVIEDGAQSFGATYKGKKSCGLSTIGCTSFFPTKPLGCYGDGGACFTNDDELAKRMDMIRRHGQDRRYHHVCMGLNSRLDTLQAAVLLAKMEIFDEEVQLRGEIGKKYSEYLMDEQIITPYICAYNSSVYAQYTICVDSRKDVQKNLLEHGISTAVHYPIPLNQQPVFVNLEKERRIVPNAEEISQKVLSLPMGAWMTDNQLKYIANAVKSSLR